MKNSLIWFLEDNLLGRILGQAKRHPTGCRATNPTERNALSGVRAGTGPAPTSPPIIFGNFVVLLSLRLYVADNESHASGNNKVTMWQQTAFLAVFNKFLLHFPRFFVIFLTQTCHFSTHFRHFSHTFVIFAVIFSIMSCNVTRKSRKSQKLE